MTHVTTHIYIYTHIRLLYSKHTLRCSGVSIDPPLRIEKNKKIKNLVKSGFYGSVLLITQLQYSEQAVTIVDIPHLQYI
jgi:hypothetical protein